MSNTAAHVTLWSGISSPPAVTGDWRNVAPGFWVRTSETGALSVYEDESLFVAVSGMVYWQGSDESGTPNQASRVAHHFRRDGALESLQLPGHFMAIVVRKDIGSAVAYGDAYGGRRVFWGRGSGGTFVSSKLLPAAQLVQGGPRMNAGVRDFALVYGYVPGDGTVFEGVSRCPADRYLVVTPEGVETSVRPARTVSRAGQHLSRTEVKAELEARLIGAVDAIVGDHDTVGVLLGGFDSAMVAALAKRAGKHVKAYTFRYEDATFNQSNIDAVVAELGIEHEWVSLSARDISHGLGDYAEVFDRPTNWPNYVIQTRVLCQRAAEDDIGLVLTGDGCDEIFLGYPGIYRGSRFFAGRVRSAKPFMKVLQRVLRVPMVEATLGHVGRLGLRIAANMQLPERTRLYLMFRILDEASLSSLYGFDLAATQRRVQQTRAVAMEHVHEQDATKLAYDGRDHIVPNRLKMSGAMDATGVLLGTPYMHPKVRDYVRALPEEMLRPDGEAKRTTLGKDVLLEMAHEHGYLPYDVIYQPKHAAVDGPLDRWYSNELRDQVRDLIGAVAPVRRKWFLDRLISEKWLDVRYRRRFSVDSITSHAVSMLSTYGAFAKQAGIAQTDDGDVAAP